MEALSKKIDFLFFFSFEKKTSALLVAPRKCVAATRHANTGRVYTRVSKLWVVVAAVVMVVVCGGGAGGDGNGGGDFDGSVPDDGGGT